MRVVFIGSPWAGDERKHEAYAVAAMHHAIACGVAPVVPHLMYPRVLEDSGPARKHAMRLGANVLKRCEELWLFVDLGVSAGMISERSIAEKAGIPVIECRVPGWLDEQQEAGFVNLLGKTRDVFVEEPTESPMPLPSNVVDLGDEAVPEEIDEETDPTPKGPILGSA